MSNNSKQTGLSRRKSIVLLASMAGSVAAAEALRPRERLSLTKPPIQLDKQVPTAFGEWKVDASIVPLLPDASVQAQLDTLYSQVLARTYVNPQGQRVMLSIAYGADQSSESTAVHRPEFCYSAQGFRVRDAGQGQLSLDGKPLLVQRLTGEMGGRYEPISYWVTLDEQAILPGLSRKLTQLRYGLRGQIPDGMLVRVSTIGMRLEESFQLQERFLRALYAIVDPTVRYRYFGR